MSKADAWMPFYVADYLRDTVHLSRDEHGAYILLLLAAWTRGGRLPNEPSRLAGIAKATPQEWRKLAPVIAPFFHVDGDDLVHGRVVKEFEKAQRLSAARREAGLKGGRPPKQPETNPKATGNLEVSQNGSQNETPARVARPSPSHPPYGGMDADASLSPGGDAQPVLIAEEPRADDVRTAFELWNALAKRTGLPTARALDDERRKRIRARLADGGLEAWRAALAAVERSRHCRGENDRSWRADLDFVCQPKSWRRLLEGSYGSDFKVSAPVAELDPKAVWRMRIGKFVESRFWLEPWGVQPRREAPQRDGVQVPDEILAEFGFPTRTSRSAA